MPALGKKLIHLDTSVHGPTLRPRFSNSTIERVCGLHNEFWTPETIFKSLLFILVANSDYHIVDLINCQKNSTFKCGVISD